MGSVDLSVEAPLIIGSIPLQQSFENFSPAIVQPNNNTAILEEPPPSSYISPPPLSQEDMPGPYIPLPCIDGIVQDIPEGFLPPAYDANCPSLSEISETMPSV